MPLPPEEGLEALVRRREAEARAASSAEVERILGIADPAERMRAYAEFRRGLEDSEALPAESDQRVVQSLRGDAPLAEEKRTVVATTWEAERRRLAVLHTLRTLAPVGIAVVALLPFAVAPWRWGWGLGDALGAFLGSMPGLAGVALALVAAGILGRMTGRADSLEGLAGLLVGALAAGTAGLAVSMGMVF